MFRMRKERLFCCLLLPLSFLMAQAQHIKTFEARYFTKDPRADGVTDLHGETEIFDNEQRVAFLNAYAAYASRFWGDPGLDTPLFADHDIEAKLAGIKPQPLTSVRRTIRLERWKAYGYKEGKRLPSRLDGGSGPRAGPGSPEDALSLTAPPSRWGFLPLGGDSG